MKTVRLYRQINNRQLKQVEKRDNLHEVEIFDDYLLLDKKIRVNLLGYDKFAIDEVNTKQERS